MWRLCLYGVLLCYLIVVLGATMMSRSEYMGGSYLVRWQLFYSYRDAWNDFSATEWRNIILNILMFVPLGFLLPFVHKQFQKAWLTYLTGFGLTVGIEMVQLMLQRGICEADDLLNNLLGTIIGYGVYRLLMAVWRGICGLREKKKGAFGWSVFLCQIPLIVTVVMFVAIFVAYDRQELGNLNSEYITKNKNIRVTSALSFDTAESMQPVYQLHVAAPKETQKQAEGFFALFGQNIEEDRTDVYENSVIYYSQASEGGESKSLWIEYDGSAFRYTDYGLLFGEEAKKATDAEENFVRAALEKLGIEIPEEAGFENLGDGQYAFTVEALKQGNVLYDGTLTCTLTEEGEISRLNQNILQFQEYRDFPVISQKEAYDRLAAGEFYYPIPFEWDIEVYDVKLAYEVDSKGFYQPIYKFFAIINSQEGYISIPAIKD